MRSAIARRLSGVSVSLFINQIVFVRLRLSSRTRISIARTVENAIPVLNAIHSRSSSVNPKKLPERSSSTTSPPDRYFSDESRLISESVSGATDAERLGRFRPVAGRPRFGVGMLRRPPRHDSPRDPRSDPSVTGRHFRARGKGTGLALFGLLPDGFYAGLGFGGLGAHGLVFGLCAGVAGDLAAESFDAIRAAPKAADFIGLHRDAGADFAAVSACDLERGLFGAGEALFAGSKREGNCVAEGFRGTFWFRLGGNRSDFIE